MYSLLRSYDGFLSLAGRYSGIAHGCWSTRGLRILDKPNGCADATVPATEDLDPHETVMLCECSLKPRGARALEGVVSCSLRTVREGGPAGSTWALILFSMQLRQ